MALETFASTPNHGITTLNGALSDSATSMPINSMALLQFTGLSSPDFGYLVITKIGTWRLHPINNPANFEVVKLTAVSGDTGTIVRAQDGTSAKAFADGDIVECVFVSAHYQHIVDTLTDETKNIAVGDATVGGSLTLGASGVDKTWNAWLPAPMWLPDTAGTLVQAIYQSSDVEVAVIPFDKDADEEIECQVMLPADYDGSALNFEVFWATSAGTTGDVFWRLWVAAFESGDTLALVTSNSNFTVQAFGAQKQMNIISKSITPNGAADGSRLLTLRFQRAATAGSDTFDADAEFIGMNVSY